MGESKLPARSRATAFCCTATFFCFTALHNGSHNTHLGAARGRGGLLDQPALGQADPLFDGIFRAQSGTGFATDPLTL